MNAFLDHRRSRRRWLPLPQAEEETDERPELVLEATQEEAALAAEDARRVRRALARLDEHWRAPLVLRYSAGLSYDEIAAVLGVSPGTVASRLNRAHRRLAKKLRGL
jgi:RNA polymerase sigma-70 factor (ECF subfamily)